MSERCPLCAHTSQVVTTQAVSVTSESKLLEAASALQVCRHCGHLFTHTSAFADGYYQSDYDATLSDDGMDEIVSTRDGSVVYRTDLDFGVFFEKVMAQRPPDTSIFELGAGRGRILSRLRKTGFHDLTAFELGTRYEAPLKALLGQDRVFIGERPKSRCFDVVISFFVLEHDQDPRASLAYLRSISAPSGTLYLMVPNFATNPVDLACADHRHHFSAELLAALVCAAGFEVVEVDETSSVGALILVARSSGGTASELSPPADALARSLSAAQPFLELDRRIKALPDRMPPEGRLFLYGAGFYATCARAALGSRDVHGVFDANPKKQGSLRLGHRVQSPERALSGEFADASLLVCVNGAIAGSIRDRFAAGFRHVDTL